MSADGDERDVLSSLPRTRPTRRSTKRDAPAAKPRAKAKTAAKTAPKAKSTARAKPRAQAKPRTRAKPKAAAGGPVKPPPAGWATPENDSAPSGGELVTTAIRAAGELAEIGATYGLQAVRRALGRLPRP